MLRIGQLLKFKIAGQHSCGITGPASIMMMAMVLQIGPGALLESKNLLWVEQPQIMMHC